MFAVPSDLLQGWGLWGGGGRKGGREGGKQALQASWRVNINVRIQMLGEMIGCEKSNFYHPLITIQAYTL